MNIASVVDQLRRQQPAPAQVVIPRAAQLAVLGSVLRYRVEPPLAGPSPSLPDVPVPAQGFTPVATSNRAPHPTATPLAFEVGYRELRRRS